MSPIQNIGNNSIAQSAQKSNSFCKVSNILTIFPNKMIIIRAKIEEHQ
jgi:hypothetical protein